MKKRVMQGDIVVGKPLDYDVLDNKDELLLRKGYVITKQSQIDTIIRRGIYFISNSIPDRDSMLAQEVVDEEGNSPPRSSFEIIEQVYVDLDDLFLSKDTHKNLSNIINRLSKLIQQACEQDKDASLSTILWPHEIRYPVKHQVDTAIACEIILKALEYSSKERLPVVAAALTMNVAMIDLQDALFYQREELNEAQRIQIRDHVLQGVEILRAFGVTDQTWLDVVMQHHEISDGSGYPKGLKQDEICEAARILTIGDIYCAKLAGRAYRTPLSPHKAMREVYRGERGHSIDPIIAQRFVREFGIYPPGSIVRLANGDIAVVIRCGKKINEPIACSIIRPDGTVYSNPRERHSSHEEFAVMDTFSEWERSGIDRYRLWGIDKTA